MNVNKINNHLQYWHDVNELSSNTNDLILIIPNNLKISKDFVVGKMSPQITHKQEVILIYENEDNACIDEVYCNWNDVIKKWIYIKDLNEVEYDKDLFK